MLAQEDIKTVDAYNIVSVLNSSESTRMYADALAVGRLHELIDMSSVLARSTAEEYKLLVSNILGASQRRDIIRKLKECEEFCFKQTDEDIAPKIYSALDEVLLEYSSASDIPRYSEVVENCWEEIKSRQGNEFAGVPFKFPALNDYVTMERGELVIFAGAAKQGKSLLLLNCAADLLKKDLAVLYIDSELSTKLFTARMLSHITGIEFKRLTSGNYSKEEGVRISRAIEWLKTVRFTHVYMPFFDTQSIYTTVKRVAHTMGLDALIVDYFKSSDEGDAWANYAALGKLTNLVKNQICGDMNLIGLGAVQLTAAGKVADSAKIGRNTSTLITIKSKEVEEIEEDGEECGNTKFHVVLNRNGPQMMPSEYIDIFFNGNLCLYEEAKQHIPHEPY